MMKQTKAVAMWRLIRRNYLLYCHFLAVLAVLCNYLEYRRPPDGPLHLFLCTAKRLFSSFLGPAACNLLNQNMNEILFFCSHFSWAEFKDLKLFLHTKKTHFCQIVLTNLSKSVSEHFFCSEIIHPPHRCGISIFWLDSTVFAQVILRLPTIKATVTDVGMLTGPPELLPVDWRFISLPIHHLKGVSSTAEVSSTSSHPQPGVTTPAQGLHIQHVYLQGSLSPASPTATAVIGVHSISA